jgi:hypothetical protein
MGLSSSSTVNSCARPRVGITSYFDDQQKRELLGVLSVSGTGWFLAPTSTVTVEHVAAAMNLSDQNWNRFVRYGDDRFSGVALFELYDGDDRLVLDYGSSGA